MFNGGIGAGAALLAREGVSQPKPTGTENSRFLLTQQILTLRHQLQIGAATAFDRVAETLGVEPRTKKTNNLKN